MRGYARARTTHTGIGRFRVTLRWGRLRRLGKLAYARQFSLPRDAKSKVYLRMEFYHLLVPRNAKGRFFGGGMRNLFVGGGYAASVSSLALDSFFPARRERQSFLGDEADFSS